jgi:DNA/RNA-binding domain of Phe-tRNA-synthetase-like protein
MTLNIDHSLEAQFPDLKVLIYHIRSVKVEKRNAELEKRRREVVQQVKARYDLESLKDVPALRAYRDFFWRVRVDPTKNRPAVEALIRRLLRGRGLPRINTLVDVYNLASVTTEVALAAFDLDKLVGALYMRSADAGDEFIGIGMTTPMRFQGGEIVVSDAEKLVAIYPHRDAESTKITATTRNVLLMVCGVPGIGEGALRDAARVAKEYIREFCGGDHTA